MVSPYLYPGLGQGALIRLILVKAIPWDRKLGQAEPNKLLVGRKSVWVNLNSTPTRGKVFPYLLGFSVQSSTMTHGSWELKTKVANEIADPCAHVQEI